MAKILLVLTVGFGSVAYSAAAQEPTPAQILAQIDAAVRTRVASLAGYTVTEHYSVFRDGDQTHPAAEMTVKTTYRRATGKTYEIVAESGSEILRHTVLRTILSNEQEINRPGIREGAYFTSSNYQMTLQPGGTQMINGRACYVLAIKPKPGTQHLVTGTLWADAANGQIVQVEGKAQKGLSFVTGPIAVFRQYANLDGFAEATSARAESNSFLFGRTLVTIDYRDYRLQTDAKPASR